MLNENLSGLKNQTSRFALGPPDGGGVDLKRSSRPICVFGAQNFKDLGGLGEWNALNLKMVGKERKTI